MTIGVLHYILGLPGAGKTTTTKSVMETLDLHDFVWDVSQMTSPERKAEIGKQRLSFKATPDLSIVVLGNYTTGSALIAHELAGPDKYSPPQRTRVKTLLAELAARGKTRHIVFDGLRLLSAGGKPLQDAIFATTKEVVVHHLDTPLGTCQTRFRIRNEVMVKEGRLPRYPTKFNLPATWADLRKKIDRYVGDKRVSAIHHHADSTAAAQAVKLALAGSGRDDVAVVVGKKRRRSARLAGLGAK